MVNRLKNRSERAGRKSGFVYAPPDAKKIKERSEQTGGRFDSIFQNGIDTWRPKVGDNLIRILPPTWDDADYYGFDAWVHSYVGVDNSTYLCPMKMKNKSCPICAAAKEAKDAGEADEAKELQAKKITLVWIIDRDDDKPTPQAWSMSWTMDRDIAALCANKRTGKILLLDDPEKGYDLTLKRQGQGLKTRYFGLAVDRDPTPIEDSEKVQDDILDYIAENPMPTVLKYYDEDYLAKVIEGTAESRDPDLEEEERPRGRRGRGKDEEEEEPPRRGTRRGRDAEEEESPRSSRVRIRKDEEEEEPPRSRRGRDEPEEEEEPPRRSARRGRDEEEEEPPPRSRRGRDAEEEEEPPRRRGRDAEEEEEPPPRSRRGRDKDEEEEPAADEEERPRGRRGRGKDEEEEEPPRSRRGREPEEEEEDPPRNERVRRTARR